MQTRSLSFLAIVILALTAAPAVARDNEGFQGNRLRLTLDHYGVHAVPSAEVLPPWAVSFGAAYDHARRPVEIGRTSDRRVARLVNEVDLLQLMFAVGLPGDLSLGAALPWSLDTDGNTLRNPNERLARTGALDMRLEAKWRAWVSTEQDAAVSVLLLATLPTGRASQFRSEDGEPTLGLLGLYERRWSSWRLLVELGYQWVEEDHKVGGAHFDDRVLFGAAVEWSLYRSEDEPAKADQGDPSEASEPHTGRADCCRICRGEAPPPRERSEPTYEVVLKASLDGASRARHMSDELTLPVEALYGLSFRCSKGFELDVALGSGISNGVGSPDLRVVVGLRASFGGARVTSAARFRDAR